ncbi:hypothetical protein Pcinc_022262 [Petrolisthes cinctipes]|uniref:MI domain-containing protein n=1 Tax=Petrolisthes cinctipes TaxID=88211 RepID=A0AAE1FEG7_PETCI|nr:hypothetical protein Pcinc_022262 [Petrolisthes cinctipes]
MVGRNSQQQCDAGGLRNSQQQCDARGSLNSQQQCDARGSLNSQQQRNEGGPVSRSSGFSRSVKVISIPCHASKLKTSNNAWKSSVKENKSDNSESETDVVVRLMRAILNKLTPEKFEKLIDSVNELPIYTTESLSAVVDLIFEKPNKKLELLEKLDYEETKMRKLSVGNIKFVGELYHRRMLTSPIMIRIIRKLLERGDEESLECLCKLLTTCGQTLEIQCRTQGKAMNNWNKHLKALEKMVSQKQTSSRLKFLMMDVLDLRQNKWVPRREENKPRTKAQIQEEVTREEMDQQIALATYSNHRDDRHRDRNRDRDRDHRRSGDNRAPQLRDDGRIMVTNTKGRTPYDSSRLKNTLNKSKPVEKEISLRGTGYSKWARGCSGGGSKDHDEGKQQESNKSNVLMDSSRGSALPVDNQGAANNVGGLQLAPGGSPTRQGGLGSKSMIPPSYDKESVISIVKKFVAQDSSKSSSLLESRDNSVPRESEALKVHPPMDSNTAEKLTMAIIEEYTNISDLNEAKLCIKEKFASNTIKHFVQFSLEWVIDRDSKKRKMVGQLFHDIIVEKILPIDQLIEGSQEILSMTEDYEIDIPKVCNYLGEIFAPCLNDNAVTLKRLFELTDAVGSNKKANVFACIVSQAAEIMGPNKVADIWKSSGLKWSDIVPSDTDRVDEFLKKYADIRNNVKSSNSYVLW